MRIFCVVEESKSTSTIQQKQAKKPASYRMYNSINMTSVDSRKNQTGMVREALKALNVQRQSLDLEAEAIVSELTSVNPATPTIPPMGIDTPLVDREGYPRNDIDVFRARTLRSRLAACKTDRNQLMADIEKKLQELASMQNTDKASQLERETTARRQEKPKPKFDPVTKKWVVRNWDGTISGADVKAMEGRLFDTLSSDTIGPLTSRTADLTISDESVKQSSAEIHLEGPTIRHAADSASALARVNSVAEQSPAEAAGLKPNDLIFAFGPVTSFENVADLLKDVAANSQVIELRVKRQGTDEKNSQDLLLRLVPRPWSGRGLLGCHIVPL